MAAIQFQDVSKIFPDGTCAVDSLDLLIDEGEFMVFVGPSGCGKTTALRMVAGLEEISEGTILIGDRVVNDVSPKDRDIAMVFQNYALYPHMTVAENLGFGLKLRKLSKADVAQRVRAAAATLGLDDYLERKPGALSGGQRQRGAMGRAIVREPRAYLMDEPLSNLDAKLRVQMRAEIQTLQRTLGVTTIYVTHDQTEAMTMGDRIAVMRDGALQQVDTPDHVYQRPANQFVAGFIGSPAMNMVDGRLSRVGETLVVSFGDHSLQLDAALLAERPAIRAYEGKEVVLGIRPEDLEDAAFASDAPPERSLTVVCRLREALGSRCSASPSRTRPDGSEDSGTSSGCVHSSWPASIRRQRRVREGLSPERQHGSCTLRPPARSRFFWLTRPASDRSRPGRWGAERNPPGQAIGLEAPRSAPHPTRGTNPPRLKLCPSNARVSVPIVEKHSDFEREQVVDRLAPADHSRLAVGDEHGGGPRHRVVGGAHRQRVRPGDRNGEDVAATRCRQLHAVDQHVPRLAMLPRDCVGVVGRLVGPVGEERRVASAVERRARVVGHPAVHRHERRRRTDRFDGADGVERESGAGDERPAGL